MQDVETIIRSWKDDDYRVSLGTDEQTALPDNPAGPLDFWREDYNQNAVRSLTLTINILTTRYCG